MVAVGVALGNVIIFLSMLAFSLAWNGLAWLRQRGRVSKLLHAYSPRRTEWSAYYWRRSRRYLVSYAIVLSVILIFPVLLGRRAMTFEQLKGFISVLPGLLGYFVLAGLVPARFHVYAEGFTCYALIPMLPGQRERGSRTFTMFRVGLTRWRDYQDAVPRGDVMLVKRETGGVELIVPRGQRDLLLGLARAGLKRAKEDRRQQRRTGTGKA